MHRILVVKNYFQQKRSSENCVLYVWIKGLSDLSRILLKTPIFPKKKFLYNSNLGMSRPWFVWELLNSKFINTSPSKILFKTPLINPCLKFTIVNSSPFLKMILFLPKHSRNLLQIQIYFKIIQVLAKSLLMKISSFGKLKKQFWVQISIQIFQKSKPN